MNLSDVFSVDMPWWGWIACAAGAGFLSLAFVAVGATGKNTARGVTTMLAAASFLVTIYCVVTGIVHLLRLAHD